MMPEGAHHKSLALTRQPSCCYTPAAHDVLHVNFVSKLITIFLEDANAAYGPTCSQCFLACLNDVLHCMVPKGLLG